jgi:hypothetical protein
MITCTECPHRTFFDGLSITVFHLYRVTHYSLFEHLVLLAIGTTISQIARGPRRQMNPWAKFVVLLAAIIRDMEPVNSDSPQVALESHLLRMARAHF